MTMRWYWLCESWVLESLVQFFRRASYWLLGVSNRIGDAAMRSAQALDPVGVEWRRQELLRWVQLKQSVDEAEANKDVELPHSS